ncbi:MAG: hypothetical protein IJF40_07315 [Clostridia bacterium]|nr:hypothetical protein [Clostridia bacterium]
MPIKKGEKRKDVSSDKKKWAFPVGIVIVIFALIGVGSVIVLATRGIADITDNSEKFTEYEQFLAPVVMNDPDPFDDVSKAEMTQLLDATIWALMKSDIDPDKYEYAEGDTSGLIVPQKDVEKQFRKLFGEDVKPVHTTVEGGTYTFTYDEANKTYIVPLTGVMPTFIPRVISQDKKGDSIILTVGYISGDGWDQDERGNYIEPAPNKYMKITLRLNDDKSYFISAIQNTEAPETAVMTTQKPVETTAEKTTIPVDTTGEDTSSSTDETQEETSSEAEE